MTEQAVFPSPLQQEQLAISPCSVAAYSVSSKAVSQTA